MSNELYTIVVSGEKLYFTKDQILSDSGNYFATYFFGGFAEGTQGTRELYLQKDIQLFKLVQAHLRGYRILPLADAVIPSYMTKEVALINLFLDAQYYGLQRLEEKIRREKPNITDLASETPPDVQPPERKRYKFAVRSNVTIGLFKLTLDICRNSSVPEVPGRSLTRRRKATKRCCPN
jgi:hypothetical protein